MLELQPAYLSVLLIIIPLEILIATKTHTGAIVLFVLSFVVAIFATILLTPVYLRLGGLWAPVLLFLDIFLFLYAPLQLREYYAAWKLNQADRIELAILSLVFVVIPTTVFLLLIPPTVGNIYFRDFQRDVESLKTGLLIIGGILVIGLPLLAGLLREEGAGCLVLSGGLGLPLVWWTGLASTEWMPLIFGIGVFVILDILSGFWELMTALVPTPFINLNGTLALVLTLVMTFAFLLSPGAISHTFKYHITGSRNLMGTFIENSMGFWIQLLKIVVYIISGIIVIAIGGGLIWLLIQWLFSIR